MIRPTVARVDLTAIADNLRAIAAFLSVSHSPVVASRPSPLAPRIIAVVKANAYGHGANAVGLTLDW